MFTHMYFTIIVDYDSSQRLKSFLHESILMKDFDHPNVLNILGVGFDIDNKSELTCMILPFMVNGDLKTYLRGQRQKPGAVDHLPKVCDKCIPRWLDLNTHCYMNNSK